MNTNGYWRKSFKIGTEGQIVHFYQVEHGRNGYVFSSIVKRPGARKNSQKFENARFRFFFELYEHIEHEVAEFDPEGYGNFPLVRELEAALREMLDYLHYVGTVGDEAGALGFQEPEDDYWTAPLANPDWVDTPADPDWADGPGEYIKENESKVWAIPAPHEDGAEEIIRV